MRYCTLLVAAAVIILGVASTALAQTPQGPLYYSPFNNLSLGRSFVPPPSGFGGGIQTGPTGNFLYLGRTDGAVDFGTPWRRPQVEAVPLLVAPSAVGRLAQLSPLPDLSAAPLAVAGVPATGTLPSAVPLTTMAPRVTAPMEQRLGMPPGIEMAGAAGAKAGTMAGGPLIRSPRLSDLLTRIAQQRGMLAAGRSIDVYVSNNAAVIEGGVRTAVDRALLANVLSLEPGVGRVAWPGKK